ncbi:MAG: hypothetical protein K5871_04895 [Lachnospiraceae bacterium]|nr:hypothetical protein [Lachnospiraceae bacterium]
MRQILIISNNVLSETDNNGKTLLNIFSKINKQNVAQLYFRGELPEVEGYRYYQLSDIDIIKGKINPQKRGREVKAIPMGGKTKASAKGLIRRTPIALQIRELFWKNSWKSSQLDEWLNDVNPDCVFFLAGDCIYAYDICEWIVEKYNCKLFTYVTDDYVLERKKERVIERFRRKKIYESLKSISTNSDQFFTICNRMKKSYLEEFGVDSELLFNRCQSLYDDKLMPAKEKDEEIVFMYAGSLYYGRGDILICLAEILGEINSSTSARKKGKLYVYTNAIPEDEFINLLEKTGAGYYGGKLNYEQLRTKLNLCDYPVFVESFDDKEVEKVRLSFSTKIPEYMSLRKTILAIGPEEIGSMDCIKNAAVCVYDLSRLREVCERMLEDEYDKQVYAQKAWEEYKKLSELNGLEYYLS